MPSVARRRRRSNVCAPAYPRFQRHFLCFGKSAALERCHLAGVGMFTNRVWEVWELRCCRGCRGGGRGRSRARFFHGNPALHAQRKPKLGSWLDVRTAHHKSTGSKRSLSPIWVRQGKAKICSCFLGIMSYVRWPGFQFVSLSVCLSVCTSQCKTPATVMTIYIAGHKI